MYKALNEASSGPTFDQVYDMAKGVANVATGMTKGKNASDYSYSSLAKAASKMVAVFPVLASRTVSAETAQMVTKYIEQKMCHLFILALQQANISTAKSGIEYLRQYHQNLDIGGDNINAIISTMNTWIDAYEAGKISEATSMSAYMHDADDGIDVDSLFESDIDLDIPAHEVAGIMKLMQEQEKIVVYDTKLNPVSINDYVVNEFATGDYHVSIKPASVYMEAGEYGGGVSKYSPYRITPEQDEEAMRLADEKYPNNGYDRSPEWYAYYRYQLSIAAQNNAKDDYEAKQKQDKDEAKEKQSRADKENHDRREAKRDRQTSRAEHQDKIRRERKERRDQKNARVSSGNNVALKDMDVKKMNDAVPSMLVVRFYSQLENGDVSTVPTEFIIGVKSKLIPVTTSEILRRIMNDNKDGKKFLKFMRMLTGELSASNVLFGFARMKDDIRSTKRKGAYGEIWNLLANRAAASKEAVKHGVRNDFSAITTVVISQNDVDELFREENFDISDPKNALHFMQSYNLIGFVIADDATESIKIMMDDGEKTFEEYAYRMFERETKDGTYKKLINLMAASK